MKRIILAVLAALSAPAAFAEGIADVGADITILPSFYYSGIQWEAQSYIVNYGNGSVWGGITDVQGTPPQDSQQREWYENNYQLTNADFEWASTQAPYSSSEYYGYKPATQWSEGNTTADIYIRRSFAIDTPLPEKMYMATGRDDGISHFYINGTLVYTTDTGWNDAEFIEMTPEMKSLLKTDGSENVLALHVHNNYGGAYADCGIYGVSQQAASIGNLPMGYNVSWNARLLFNSEGGYNYRYNNYENPIHGWSKLYEVQESDVYTITMPTPTYNADFGQVQFKTPITINPEHKYRVRFVISTNNSLEQSVLYLSENENNNHILYSTDITATPDKSQSITKSNIQGTDINDLKIDFRFATWEENTVITISDIVIYDQTDKVHLWPSTSYYNYCYYADGETGQRIKDMDISGRTETLSWTEADFDDSMWQEAPMPIGNWGYIPEVKTIWPGDDNTNFWIRRNFTIDEIKSTSKYTLQVCHDDNYSIYVNGHLLQSETGWTEGKDYIKIEIPSKYLNQGQNVIATYIQQNWGGKFFDCGLSVVENAYEESDTDVDRPASLIANEIEIANIDQIIDHSYNYGGWVELYNKSDKRISLDFLYVSDDPDNLTKFRLPASYGVIQPHDFRCIFFDHNSIDGVYGETANKQVDFKLNADGGTIYISEDGTTPFITLPYPTSITRCSYARKAVDSDEWGLNGHPTPNAANSSNFANQRLDAPVVDTDSKLFTDAFSLSVDIPEGATLRYTTDGTAPTWTNGSVSSDGKFNISQTTNFRFRLFQEGTLPSPVVTRSYIFRDQDYYLPVISITTNPDNLYDDIIGVYVDGTNGVSGRNHDKSNLNMDWERPVNFEYITADNKMGLNLEAEFKVSGGWSRHYSPASFKIKASKLYEGQKSLDFPFFPHKPYNKYKQILIRNGGNDNDAHYHGRVRDAITQETLISSGFYVDAQDYQPVHVFFNGQYIGQLNLREPNNRYNGTANYGYDDDEMDAFEYSNGYFQMAGTKDAFDHWREVAAEVGMGNAPFDELRQIVDIDEYTNFWAAISYIGCSDWICNNNNLKGYRSLPDGKFHLTVLDQDWGWSNLSALHQLENNYGNEMLQIYNFTKWAPEFQRQFVDAYCILNGSVFTPERNEAIADSICRLVEPALAMEGRQPWTSYNEQRQNMSSDQARNTRMQALRNCYNLSDGMDVSFSANIPQASFRINNQPVPTGKFDGTLFAPVSIETSAPAGYNFAGWKALIHYELKPFGFGSEWAYYDQGSLDDVQWTRIKFDDWSTGLAPLGYGKDNIATTISYGGDSSNKYPTYYFRKNFTLDHNLPENDEVQLNFVADDGFVLYLNGHEIARYNMPEGDVNYNTFAPTYAEGNPDSGTIKIDATLLRKGTNRLAVEVHNNVPGSTDIYWDAELVIISGSQDEIISTERLLQLDEDTSMSLEAIYELLPEEYLAATGQTPVVINEVSAANTIFVNDYYKRNDWIELYNTTDHDIDIAGMYLSDNPSNPLKYQIPASDGTFSTIIPAFGFLVVWADKLDPLMQLHSTFKLSNSDDETVIITAADESWSNSLTYTAHNGEESVGRYPDGGSRVYKMTKPTIHAPNTLTSYAQLISGENKNFDLDEYLSIEGITPDAPMARDMQFYTVDGIRLNAPQRGINIVRMTDGTTRKVIIK